MDEDSMRIPTNRQFLAESGEINRDWYLFLSQLGDKQEQTTRSGTTAQRPIERVFIGMRFYDATLNKPVYVASVNPIVWRDSSGTVV